MELKTASKAFWCETHTPRLLQQMFGFTTARGTILGTVIAESVSRSMPKECFKTKHYKEAVHIFNAGHRALVVLGGKETSQLLKSFDRLGVPVVGVPKTIDNDLACNELTFGFITALDIATTARSAPTTLSRMIA